MAERRRREDDPMENHASERAIDWQRGAPRWLLLALLSVTTLVAVAASNLAWSLYQAREADLERRYADWKGGAIADHEYRITTLERESKNGREDAARLDAAAKLTRLQTQMEAVNDNVRTLTAEVRRALREN